jgi:hypothetical protein
VEVPRNRCLWAESEHSPYLPYAARVSDGEAFGGRASRGAEVAREAGSARLICQPEVEVRFRRQARAGAYAEARYRRGLHAYRRRLRVPLLIVVVPLFVFFWAITLTHKLDYWSLMAGMSATAAMLFISFVRDEPPQHVVNWQRGAEGERKTEKAVRPLERRGWHVEHDIQIEGRANLDHVVIGPPGVFLLETKNLAGTISFEDGVLVARQFDDPDEVFRYRSLAPERGSGPALSLSCEGGRMPTLSRSARHEGRTSAVGGGNSKRPIRRWMNDPDLRLLVQRDARPR